MNENRLNVGSLFLAAVASFGSRYSLCGQIRFSRQNRFLNGYVGHSPSIYMAWLGKLLGKIQEKRVDYRVWTILGNKNNLHGGLYWKLHIWAFSLRSSFSRKICLVV